MDDQEERIKNKKYRSLKMFPSDIILKFKNIVKFNQNKFLKLKKLYTNGKREQSLFTCLNLRRSTPQIHNAIRDQAAAQTQTAHQRQYYRDHQEDHTLIESLVAFTAPVLMNPSTDAFSPIYTRSSSLLIPPTPEHFTCLLSPSFFQEHAVLGKLEAQDPGPPPSILHHLDPCMPVDPPGGHLERGEHHQLFPEDEVFESLIPNLDSREL